MKITTPIRPARTCLASRRRFPVVLSVHMPSCSETEFQGQLKRARPALLKDRVQAAETLIGHRGRAEERRARSDERERIGEIGMVKKIECVRSELQPDPFRKGKFPAERQIHLSQTKTRNVVAAFGALLT